MDERTLKAAVKAAHKKIRCLSRKALNSNLEHFCGDYADAYLTGVEEAQNEILLRLLALAEKPFKPNSPSAGEPHG